MAVFLRENGVLTMGNKTPVTILQETLQRRGLTPQYELIYNGVGTMDPVFKFVVSAIGFTAIGDGKSKKEAKHDAAAALLKRMQVVPDEGVEELDITSPYSGALKQNFVGMLDETCVTNKIPLPMYVPISEQGPPHARIFTMQCRVSTCTEVATARTKKQAKHLVAQQMISRIANILGDKYIPPAEKSMDIDDPEEEHNLKAIESGSFRHDLSIPLADLHNVFYHRMEEFLVPQMFLDLPAKPEELYEQMENPKEFLDELMRGLEGTCKVISTSAIALQEAFQEIEKECEKWGWVEDECIEEEVEQFSDEDECMTNCKNVFLEEFDLEDSYKEEKSIFFNESSKLDNLMKAEENTNMNSCEKKLKELDLGDLKESVLIGEKKTNCQPESIDPTAKPFYLFISIECPQGSWAFRGFGKTWEEAVDEAALRAIKFLRVMAIPSNSKDVTKTSES